MCSLFIVHLVTKGIKKIHENKISIPCKADGSKDRQNIVFSGNIVANITTMSANREDLLFDQISNENKQM